MLYCKPKRNWIKYFFRVECLHVNELGKLFDQTSLNVFRLHEILPNMSSSTGSWATIKIVTNIRWISLGIQYHLRLPSTILMVSNAAPTRWPNSQKPKIAITEQIKWKINRITSIESWCWKKNEENRRLFYW